MSDLSFCFCLFACAYVVVFTSAHGFFEEICLFYENESN